MSQQNNSGCYMKEKKKADETMKLKRTSKEERLRLMEERKKLKEQEMFLKDASKAEAIELKKSKKKMQKWEKGTYALKFIVAEIDKKVVELRSIGGTVPKKIVEVMGIPGRILLVIYRGNMTGNSEWDNRIMDSLKKIDLSSPEVEQRFALEVNFAKSQIIATIESQFTINRRHENHIFVLHKVVL